MGTEAVNVDATHNNREQGQTVQFGQMFWLIPILCSWCQCFILTEQKLGKFSFCESTM
jgi:hypothetical protein